MRNLKTIERQKEEKRIRLLPYKIRLLQEKLGVAIDAKATRQATFIREKIKKEYTTWRIEHECPYPEVTMDQARKEMCEGVLVFPGVSDWDRMRGNIRRCDFQFCYDYASHTHNAVLLCEMLNAEGIEIPYAALIRLREAQDKKLFDAFEIWRPVAALPTQDPWLVGKANGRCFKICSWI